MDRSTNIMETTLYGFEVREPDRRVTGREKPTEIKRLWQLSHEIIGLALRGQTNKEIAEQLGVTPVTVSNTLNSKLGKEKLSRLRKERDEDIVNVAEEVAKLSKKALQVYERIFDNPDSSEKLRKEAADTVLMDLGGHRAPTKVDSRHLSVYATAEEIEAFKKRGIEAAREAGILIEDNARRRAEEAENRGV